MKPKELLRKSIHKSLSYAKKAVSRNERLKNFAKKVVLDHVHLNDQVSQDTYEAWAKQHYPDGIDLWQQKKEAGKLKQRPLISVLTPVYNTDLTFLSEALLSVQAQTYENWELCVVDDASTKPEVRDLIKDFASKDKRIKYFFRKENGHISAATNDCLKIAGGDYVALFDHDDLLWPNALFEVVKALNNNPKLDFIYTDEEMVFKDRRDHRHPFFKPDWNPEFLESVNMITHFAVIRRSVVEKVGGFRKGFEGAQDWDLFLRVTHNMNPEKIYHIPTILYSWRMSETSTALTMGSKPYVREAQRRALEESLKARGAEAQAEQGVLRDYWNVVYPVVGDPKISIVIPSKNQFKVVKRCVDSIFAKTTYKNFEIVLVDTGSTDKKVHEWYKSVARKHSNFKVLDWPEQPFSYVRSCNFGAKESTGEFLVFLNNDTEVITPRWLELLLSDAQREGIGAVGCKLYYPDRVHIQHAGIGIGFGGVAANSLSQVHSKQMTSLQHIYGDTRHEVSAVTAAALMVKKDRFDEIKGFDEKFRITYNDVDLCLRLRKAGYRNIYSPMVELMHYESLSLGRPEEKEVRDTKEFNEAKQLFKRRWHDIIEHDPHLNPNIERSNASFEVAKV